MNNIQRILKVYGKDYTMIFLGLTLFSVGFTAFILPNKIVIGGLVGVGTILRELYQIKVWEFTTIVNVLLLLIALRVIGREFVLKTIISIGVLSFTIGLGEEYITTFMSSQRFITSEIIQVLLAAVCLGGGLGVVYAHNGSTGGADIIGFLAMKLFRLDLSLFMTILNCSIIITSYFILPPSENSLQRTIYGLILIPTLWSFVHWIMKKQQN